ncbi:MAG: HAMP domain-containing protein [Candidatus Aminicenantes bacterium]|nr:MAG: HAMP domain-containing protein [Candidatus Aminicenantes bacterium]
MKIKKFRSLSFKLTLWYVVILGGIIILAGIFQYQGFKDGLLHDLDVKLLEIADETYESWYRERGVSWEDAIQKSKIRFQSYQPLIQLVQLGEKDKKKIEKVIRDPQIPEKSFLFDNKTYYQADRSDIDSLIYETLIEKKLGAYPVRTLLFPIRGPNIMQVGISLEKTELDLRRLMIVMFLAGGGLMLLASLGGNFIIRKALKPVKSVVRTAKDITADDLSLRIEAGKRKDEIGELVDTINDMISRLEKSVKKIKQFSGDVSHELRTPLTIIRGEIEVLLRKERSKEEYQKTLKSNLEEAAYLERIIDDLLFLSRIEALEKKEFDKSVPLDEILLKVLESQELAAKKESITLDIKKVEPAQIKGEEILLERMIANIVDNAIRYTHPGGKVEVSLDKKNGIYTLQVQDTGSGIPEESLPLIFDRFYVVDKSRFKETGGLGLGLSIVKQVADCHGGKIEVESELNEGTKFLIRFPETQ